MLANATVPKTTLLSKRNIALIFCFFISLTLSAQPVITGITPNKSTIGNNVSINGTGFSPISANNTVYFGSVMANISAATNSTITVAVPTGYSSEPITVTSNNLTAYGTPFDVTFVGGGPFTSGSFEPRIDIASPYPYDVASCDINGDGKPELITVNEAADIVSVFKNTSTPNNINFLTKTDWPTGHSPGKIVIADIDGDGLKDILVLNQSTPYSISILRNTSTGGNISFAPKIDYPLSAKVYNFTVGEIDGDGKPDIIANINNTSNVIIYRNTSVPGSVSFNSALTISAGINADGITVADINANGKADIITCNDIDGKVTVLNNTSSSGNISFAAPVAFVTAASPVGVAVGDLDDDGKPDIVVTSAGGYSISILKNNCSVTTISFAPKQDLVANFGAWDVKIADIDGDGKPDIVCGTSDNVVSKISLYKNISTTGSISFNNKVDYTASANTKQLAIADFDNDGALDIATCHNTANKLAIFRNKINNQPVITSFTPTSAGTGAFVTITGTNLASVTGVSFGGVPAMSFTVNSDISVTAQVAAGASGNVNLNAPAGIASQSGFTFISAPSITSISPLSGPAGQVVNITGNYFGTTPSSNIVYFGGARAVVNSASATNLSVAVPTNANYEPISVTNNNYSAWFKKPFDITFPNGLFSNTAFVQKINLNDNNLDNSENITIADIDGDGKSDIITDNGIGRGVLIYRNTTQNGIIAFAAAVGLFPHGDYQSNVVAADFNGDGKLDLAVSSETSGLISVFQNNSTPGNISFSAAAKFGVGRFPDHVSAGDIDGDGMADIVVSNNSTKAISVLRNISTATTIGFEAQKTYPTRNYQSECNFIGDVDGDGKLDIILANSGDTTFSIYRNTSTVGNINLATRQDYPSGRKTTEFVTMADVDGDGKQDIILCTVNAAVKGDSTIGIFRNMSTPGNFVFAPKIGFPSSLSWNVSFCDVDGDNKPDMLFNSFDTSHVVKNISTPGNISFGTNLNFLTNFNHLNGIAAADLNNDGKPDIASVTNNGVNRLCVLINQTDANPPLCVGSNGTLISDITGSLYFWQVDTGSGFHYISDGTEYSGTRTDTLHLINVQPSWNGYRYRCYVTDGLPPYSVVYTLTVNGNTPAVSITTPTTTICSGTVATFTATPVYGGTTPIYQWQINGINVGINSNVFTTTTLNNGDQVKVILTSNASCSNGTTTESNTITMNTGSTLTVGVNITASDTSVCSGNNVTFTAIPVNGGTSPSYQWQINGINVGPNSNIFTTSNFNNNDQVKVILNSSLSCTPTPTATSNIITMSVSSVLIPTVNISTAGTNICSGNNVTFTTIAVHGGASPSYQWQINGVNTGSNSSTFTTSTLKNNDQVKVILTSSLSCASTPTATSNVLTMSITASPIANAGNDITICSGSNTTLNGSGGANYSWTPATGLNNPAIANPVASPTTTTTYILTVTNTVNCIAKDTVVVTVNPTATSPKVSISTPALNICMGTPAIFTATGINAGINPIYQWSVNAVNANGNSNVFTSTTLNNNDQIKVVLTSNSTCTINNTATSNIITMNVQQLSTPLVTLNNKIFTVTNPEVAAVYTWQILSSGIWADVVPAANGITYPIVTPGEYRVKAVKGVCTAYSQSQAATLKITIPNNPYGINLYPNPSTNSITLDSIKLAQNWATLKVLNAEGQTVLPLVNIKNLSSVVIDISSLWPGTYFVQLRRENGESTTIGFIKI